MSASDILAVLGLLITLIISVIGGVWKLLDRMKTDNINTVSELKSNLNNMEKKNASSIAELRSHIDTRIDKLHTMVEEKNSSLQQYVNDGMHEIKEENKELRNKCSVLHDSVHNVEKDMLKFRVDILSEENTRHNRHTTE